MARLYPYLGPAAIRERERTSPRGAAIRSTDDLAAWVAEHPTALREGATFVVEADGTLRLAPRRSEHVACAGGGDVQTAGEMGLARSARGAITIATLTNQSTGYAPEPESFAAIAKALRGAGIAAPDGWTHAFRFRVCPSCTQLNVIKDDDFSCAVCGADLPRGRDG